MKLRCLIAGLGLVFLSGCANWTTYNKARTVETGKASVYFTDAKQRTVISSYNKLPGDKEPMQRFCAEPSPDALSALAANFGVNLTNTDKSLGAQQSLAESAASIGLRTASIQILRDIMYRECEAYINGGITSFGLETLQRRFQSTLVAVMAIEGLTGAVKAPAVALSGNASQMNAQALETASGVKDKAEAEVKTAAEAVAAAEKKLNEANQADPVVTATVEAATANLNAAKATKEDKDKNLAAASAFLDQVRSGSGSASSNATVYNVQQAPLSDQAAAAIAGSVERIVGATLTLPFGREVCTTMFGQIIANSKGVSAVATDQQTLISTCLNYLQQTGELLQAQSGAITSNTKLTETLSTAVLNETNAAKRKDYLEALKAVQAAQTADVASADTTPLAVTSTGTIKIPPTVQFLPLSGNIKLTEDQKKQIERILQDQQ